MNYLWLLSNGLINEHKEACTLWLLSHQYREWHTLLAGFFVELILRASWSVAFSSWKNIGYAFHTRIFLRKSNKKAPFLPRLIKFLKDSGKSQQRLRGVKNGLVNDEEICEENLWQLYDYRLVTSSVAHCSVKGNPLGSQEFLNCPQIPQSWTQIPKTL